MRSDLFDAPGRACGAPRHLVDLTLQLHHETQQASVGHGAVLVSEDGDRRKAVWLPKSAIEIERRAKAIVVVTMPERLAIENGLM